VNENQIRDIDWISQFHQLRSLHLDNNLVSALKITPDVMPSSLEELHASNNMIACMQVGVCPNLKILKLRQNKLTEFPYGLIDLGKLEILDLAQNYIDGNPEDLKNFLSSLPPTITQLYLSPNPFIARMRRYRQCVLATVQGKLTFLDTKFVTQEDIEIAKACPDMAQKIREKYACNKRSELIERVEGLKRLQASIGVSPSSVDLCREIIVLSGRNYLNFSHAFFLVHTFQNMTERPDLLDGLFRDSDERSSSSSSSNDEDDELVEIAEKILTGDFSKNQWIPARRGNLFFHDTNNSKLILLRKGMYFEYQGDGEFQCIGNVHSRPVEDTQAVVETNKNDIQETPRNPVPAVWLTSVPGSTLAISPPQTADEEQGATKRQRMKDSDLLSSAEARVPGFTEFAKKWSLPESTIRHVFKYNDRSLLLYVMRRFNPTKAKAKNAFLNFCDSLVSKFPQIWRSKSLIEMNLFEEADAVELYKMGCFRPEGILFSCDDSSIDGSILLDGVGDSDISGNFFFLNDDLYVLMNRDDKDVTVLVDGTRALTIEGPVGPLRDGSVITFSRDKSGGPDHLILVEMSANEMDLLNRRTGSQSVSAHDL
jgi:hypothetical protein